jgi:rhomboid protease GluP
LIVQLDYVFWSLAFHLVNKEDYRLIKLSENQRELWFERNRKGPFPLIRLHRFDIDWSNWLKRDIEQTAYRGEQIRKERFKRELDILNIYISMYPPVDDYEFRLEKPYSEQSAPRTKVTSIILDHTFANWNQIAAHLQQPLPFPSINQVSSADVMWKQQATILTSIKQEKEEKALFTVGKPLFTYFFLVIQIMMFMVLEWAGGSQNPLTLIQYGAKFNPLIQKGEWWRLITPMFLHIGLLHLLMNSLALYYFGSIVERIFGNSRFLMIYIISGIFGTVASFALSPSLSAGASGAIFGCFGALLYFGVRRPSLFFRTMGANLLTLLGINLLIGFIIPAVDNAGHIGGLIGGFLAAGIVHLPKERFQWGQLLFFVISIALIIIGMWYGLQIDYLA